MNLSACGSLAVSPLAGTWYRAVQMKFWSTLLSTSHTKIVPGRFNAGNALRPGFEILYFAEDHMVALFEVQALLGSPFPGSPTVPNPSGAWVVINVGIQLSRVADLTLRSERSLLDTNVEELTGDWRGYSLRTPTPVPAAPYWTRVPTQKLGHALQSVPDLEGFLTYSARVSTRKNLIVFPDKLDPTSSITFHNPATGVTHKLP